MSRRQHKLVLHVRPQRYAASTFRASLQHHNGFSSQSVHSSQSSCTTVVVFLNLMNEVCLSHLNHALGAALLLCCVHTQLLIYTRRYIEETLDKGCRTAATPAAPHKHDGTARRNGPAARTGSPGPTTRGAAARTDWPGKWQHSCRSRQAVDRQADRHEAGRAHDLGT